MGIKTMRSKQSIKGLKEMLRYIRGTNKVMAEVGCYAGEATRIFSNWCKKVIAIDPWQEIVIDGKLRYKDKMFDVERAFDDVMKASEKQNIIKMKMTSVEAVEKIEDNILDFVYIDGRHSYKAVCQDNEIWAPKVRVGGWICGHDFTDKHDPVREAVLDTLGKPEKVFREGSWVIRKK